MGEEKGDLMRANGTCVAFGWSDCDAMTLVMVVAGTVHHAMSVPWLGVGERQKDPLMTEGRWVHPRVG